MECHQLLGTAAGIHERGAEARHDREVGHAYAAHRTDHVRIARLEHGGEPGREAFHQPLVDLIRLADPVVRTGGRVVVHLHVERTLRRRSAAERQAGERPARAQRLFARRGELERGAEIPQHRATPEDPVRRCERERIDPPVAVPIADDQRGAAGARGASRERRPAVPAVRRLERIRRVEDVDVRAAIGIAVERNEVVLPVAGHVRGDDRRAAEVVLALGGLVHLRLEHEAVWRRVEQIHAHARIRVLVQGRELLRAAAPREASDREAHA